MIMTSSRIEISLLWDVLYASRTFRRDTSILVFPHVDCVQSVCTVCICNYNWVQFSNPLVTLQRARIGFGAVRERARSGSIGARGDRYANDWDSFLRDFASSSLLFFFSFSLSFPLLRIYFCFLSVLMPRAPPRRISMSRREYCSFARCSPPVAFV